MKKNRCLILGIFVSIVLFMGNDRVFAIDKIFRVLIIDPIHCESGQFCKQVLAFLPRDAQIKYADLSTLAEVVNQSWDVIVAVRPDPANYTNEAAKLLKLVLQNQKSSLLVFGIPSKQKNVKELFDLLGQRSPATIGKHFNNNFEKSFWIWCAETKADQTVYFRKVFNIGQMPSRANLLVTADNRLKVRLNGQLLGSNKQWAEPMVFDVVDKIKVGQNILAVEAYNENAAAGLICSLNGYGDDGICSIDINSDKTWRCSENLSEGWLEADFNDLSWDEAGELANVDGGPWLGKFMANFQGNEMTISLSRSKHPTTANLQLSLGKTVVVDSLAPRSGATVLLLSEKVPVAVAGDGPDGRIIIISAYPERSRDGEGQNDLLDNENFSNFVLQSVMWLARMPESGKFVNFTKDKTITNSAEVHKIDAKTMFPIAMGMTPLPHMGVLENQEMPRTQAGIRQIIDSIIEHGFTCLSVPSQVHLPDNLEHYAREYAQDRGMLINYNTSGAQLFERDTKLGECAYSSEYKDKVTAKVKELTLPFKDVPNLYNAFMYFDEPFYSGLDAFSYNNQVKSIFKKRYGYDLPADTESIRTNPKVWLDVINFRADYFPDALRQVYKITKEINSKFDVAITYDSHNTFGGGVGQEENLAINDVFHWGCDFADTFLFDIYPYMLIDFRNGENSIIPKPRLAQTHYAMAQMRNVATTYKKQNGFWFETYNRLWFDLTPEKRQNYWFEAEMTYTAVANGVDFLIAGYGIPEDYQHWYTLGEGLKVIQKVGGQMNNVPKLKAKAAFLFPRTQYIQLQEEYWNVAQSYELFMRAFGELDIIHEEQITDDNLNGYAILTMFDIKLLPENVAKHIETFVRKGGIVVADCVPNLDKYKNDMSIMENLFGVKNAATDRIMPDKPYVRNEVAVRGKALGQTFDFTIVSPRPCQVVDGEALLKSQADKPALIKKQLDKGQVYLLGFCMQDSYFATWKQEDMNSRNMLSKLVKAIADDANIQPHVYSSNADIEVSVRSNDKKGYLLVINHEAVTSKTVIRLTDLPFNIKHVKDVDSGKDVCFTKIPGGLELDLSVSQYAPSLMTLLPY